MEIHIWHKVYFLERHLKKVPARKKDALRQLSLKVRAIYDPAYAHPWLIGPLARANAGRGA